VSSITYSLFNLIRVSTTMEMQQSQIYSIQEHIYKQFVLINNNIRTLTRAFLAR